MSNIEAVTKVADQLISRLFDQRQFTNGEIDFMVKEIGESVNLDGNFDKLLKINENVCLISDGHREDLCLAYDDKTSTICDEVSKLLARTESILKLEGEYRDKEEKVLGATRHAMERRKKECIVDCNSKLEKLKELILEEELELERKYLKFEENLRNK